MANKLLRRFVNSGWLWIFIAALPAILLYCNRVLLPDASTDVLSYHLFNGQRAAHNPFLGFLPSEYYPVGIGAIPAWYDLANYFVRILLGYRLGTLLDLLAVIGSLIILFKLLVRLLGERGKRFHAGWGLLLVNAGIILELYFQLATYFVDDLNAFFVLLVTYFILTEPLWPKHTLPPIRRWLLQWLAIGALLALKLTNIGLVLPLMAILLWRLWQHRNKAVAKQLLVFVLAAAVIVLPLLPNWVANYSVSKNPVFPYYNKVFQSPDYSKIDFHDNNFGGNNIVAKLFWPVASLSDQMKLGEPHHIYNDYKLVVYWGVGLLLATLMLIRRIKLPRTASLLVFYFLSSILFWSATFGINRYAISTLMLGGIIFAVMVMQAGEWRHKSLRALWAVLCLAIFIGLGTESYRLIRFNMHYDMSWRQPYYQNPLVHKSQKPYLFADALQLNQKQQAVVDHADILLNCHTNVAGLVILLPHTANKPLVNIISADLPQYADMADNGHYRTVLRQRLERSIGKRALYSWVTVTNSKDIGPTDIDCLKNISARGGSITDSSSLESFLGYRNISPTLVSGTIHL